MIITNYITRKILKSFFVSLTFISFFILSAKIFNLLDKNQSLLELWSLIIWLLPYTLAYSVPISFMLAVTLVLSQMSLDNEIVALRAAGISQKKIITPLLFISIILSFFCFYIQFYQLPKNRNALLQSSQLIAQQSFLFNESTYIPLNKKNFLYFDYRDQGQFYGLDIVNLDSNKKIKTRIFAKNGKIFYEENKIKLSLNDVKTIHYNSKKNIIHLSPSKETQYSFSTNDDTKINFLLSKAKNHRNMNMNQLLDKLIYEKQEVVKGNINYITTMYEINARFSLALSPFIFTLLIIPLSFLRSRSSHKSSNFLHCITILFIYYSLYNYFKSFKYKYDLNPEILILLPNFIAIFIALYLIKRNIRL